MKSLKLFLYVYHNIIPRSGGRQPEGVGERPGAQLQRRLPVVQRGRRAVWQKPGALGGKRAEKIFGQLRRSGGRRAQRRPLRWKLQLKLQLCLRGDARTLTPQLSRVKKCYLILLWNINFFTFKTTLKISLFDVHLFVYLTWGGSKYLFLDSSKHLSRWLSTPFFMISAFLLWYTKSIRVSW